jgi:sugar phosphate permease
MNAEAARMTGERWARIVPAVLLMYTISYFDRVNIGLALPSMSRDLGLSPGAAGLAGGIFFWGYLVTFLAAGWLAPRFGPRRTVLWSLIAWGFAAMLTGFVRSEGELLAVRLLLGAAEGPVWASTAMLLSQWFLKPERARAFGLWNLCIPVGALLAGPISGMILAHSSWRTMFVVEGLPAWIWAVGWWVIVPQSPETATWLGSEERERLRAGLAAELADHGRQGHDGLNAVLRHPIVWALLGGFSLINMVSYGFTLWLPSALKASGTLSIGGIGWLSALPYAAAIPGLLLITRSSDKWGERRMHASIPMVIIGTLLLAGVHLDHGSVVAEMVVFTAMGFFLYMYLPIIFTFATEILPHQTAIPAVAFIGGVGNLFGGFVGPTMVGWLRGVSGGFMVPFTVLGIGGILGGVLILAVRGKPQHEAAALASLRS